MVRAPYQILVIPYRLIDDEPLYLILKVTDEEYWQFVAGGGEDQETPLQAARRECREETGQEGDLFQLDSLTTIPRYHFLSADTWGEETYVIPEFTFAIKVFNEKVQLSREHIKYCWVTYPQGTRLLKWDSNRNALWELNERLKKESYP